MLSGNRNPSRRQKSLLFPLHPTASQSYQQVLHLQNSFFKSITQMTLVKGKQWRHVNLCLLKGQMKRDDNTLNATTWFSHPKMIANQDFYLLQVERVKFQWKDVALLMKWWWLNAFQLFQIKMKANRLKPFKSFTLFQSCAKVRHMSHILLAWTTFIYNL